MFERKIFSDPFSPFGEPIAQGNRVSNLESRAEKAEAALHAARRDLAAERERAGLAAEVDVAAARRKERKRISAILASPVASLMPDIAATFALRTATSAAEAIALMEAAAPPPDNSKALADAIVHAGLVRRGLAEAPTTAGAKAMVRATAEDILAAGAKARRGRGEA